MVSALIYALMYRFGHYYVQGVSYRYHPGPAPVASVTRSTC